MNARVMCLRVVAIASAAAIVFNPSVASADPPGPHQPDMTKGYCPGGRFGFGKLGVCDGDKYSDGSYWHQWMTRYITGPSVLLRLCGRRRTTAGSATAWRLRRQYSARSVAPSRA
jgi:hypothetical protein